EALALLGGRDAVDVAEVGGAARPGAVEQRADEEVAAAIGSGDDVPRAAGDRRQVEGRGDGLASQDALQAGDVRSGALEGAAFHGVSAADIVLGLGDERLTVLAF